MYSGMDRCNCVYCRGVISGGGCVNNQIFKPAPSQVTVAEVEQLKKHIESIQKPGIGITAEDLVKGTSINKAKASDMKDVYINTRRRISRGTRGNQLAEVKRYDDEILIQFDKSIYEVWLGRKELEIINEMMKDNS